MEFLPRDILWIHRLLYFALAFESLLLFRLVRWFRLLSCTSGPFLDLRDLALQNHSQVFVQSFLEQLGNYNDKHSDDRK